MSLPTKLSSLVPTFLLVLFIGCGGVERPELATVKGRVTLKGQPVPLAKVIFIPNAGGQSSSGETGPNGDYELFFRYEEPGAELGKHKISVSTFEPPEVFPAHDSSHRTRAFPLDLIAYNFRVNSSPAPMAPISVTQIKAG